MMLKSKIACGALALLLAGTVSLPSSNADAAEMAKDIAKTEMTKFSLTVDGQDLDLDGEMKEITKDGITFSITRRDGKETKPLTDAEMENLESAGCSSVELDEEDIKNFNDTATFEGNTESGARSGVEVDL
ncbi:hypothetical protein [Anaerolentibacter hominis]|uniref:hypothetical protein n=1 Tax=Anaerolentibacter hominis TaxID=3079009 RepID=UPI0031B8AA0F